jgi:amino acid adenylation domain-containing protein
MENVQQETFAFPASAAQRRLWILSQFSGAAAAYHILGVLRVKGSFRLDVFRQCIAYIAERQESLRTTFEQQDGIILQIVRPHLEYQVPLLQLPLQEQLGRELRQSFDLEKGPLCRISMVQDHDNAYLVCCMHHIIADGWSMNIFIRELSAVYNAFLHQRYPSLPELDIRYSDYAVWQHELEESGALQPHLDYWLQRLQNAPALLELPTDFPRPPLQTFRGRAFEQAGIPAQAKALQELCRRYHTTPFIVMLAAFKVLLFRYTGQQDLVLGTPVANRSRKELEGIIGCFMNAVPLRTQLQENMSFAALLEQLKRRLPEDLDHQQVSLEKLLELVPQQRSAAWHPLFQVMFSLQAFEPAALHWEGVETEIVPVEMGYSKFDLTLTIRDEQERYCAIWEYNTALFEEGTIKRLAGHFDRILQQVCWQPALPLHAITLLTAAEEQQLLLTWNSTAVSWPSPACLHACFEQQVKLSPHNTAVMDRQGAFTYVALNSMANRLAHYLLAAGLQKGQGVAVSMERSRYLLVALLGIMKAGGVYVPVDPAYPDERKNYILEDAGVQQQLSAIDTMEAELLQWPDTDPALDLTGADPVYVIYTSGSTGLPKGVRIPHAALVNFLRSMAEHTGIQEKDRLLAVTSLSFDIAGLELYLPLLTGATVVVASRQLTQNGQALAQSLEHFDITFMQATPATWRLMLDAGWQGRPALTILCGGEAFPRELADRLLSKAAAVWNMYGPTETTIWSAMYKLGPDERAVVPLGRPIANTSMYILDEHLQPVPVGVGGTLYIGGHGLAIDYHNRPALTAERFIPHPFIPGERLYNTGDTARYLPDGNIVFMGRADLQVKVNGHRIELEEPAWHLAAITGVKQAVVTVRTDTAGTNRLVAYIVPETAPLSAGHLRSALQQKLPAYMVPSLFVWMDALPLTPNGKIDRKALPAPDLPDLHAQQPYEPPQTKAERLLARIWEEVLEVNKPGMHDNFFDLGGASLQGISVVHKAAQAGLHITPEMIFEFPTIRALAARARTAAPVAVAADDGEDELFTPDMLWHSAGRVPPVVRRPNIIIESLAGYLPEKIVTSKEVLAGCANAVRFPIEKLTGVKTRRMVGDNEYAFDLALKAMEQCLALSRYRAEDIDVLLACNIFRIDRQDTLTLEPCTAVRLARQAGCTAALTFDVANACAGVFTGLLLAENFIRNGQARRVMLVSGEYLSHLTSSHQPLIKDYLDPAIAALTMGDAGLAMILEATEDPSKGFIDLDFFTMGAYSGLCVVKASTERPGFSGVADAIRMMEAGHQETTRHAMRTLIKNRWSPDKVDFLIMHQASSVAVSQTRSAINRFLNKEIATADNVIDNIQHRGNTASTTHWIAVQDLIFNGKMTNGQHLLLYISGSGLNIGTALYALDDLPEKMARYHQTGIPTPKRLALPPVSTVPHQQRVQCIASAVTLRANARSRQATALGWATEAAEVCLQQATGIDRSEIGLLCYTGLHRDEHIFEPAIAAILAGNLSVNAVNNQPADHPRTVCFDIFNSDLGFLQACFTAAQFITAGPCKYALVSAAEMENNNGSADAPLLGLEEGGAAFLLQAAGRDNGGFGRFIFKTIPGSGNDIQTWVAWPAGQPVLRRLKRSSYRQAMLAPLQELAAELLLAEELRPEEIDYLLPPFTDSGFIAQLTACLQLPNAALPSGIGSRDAASMTLPCLLNQLLEQQPQQGKKALLLSAAAGRQIGGAIYFF